MHIKQKNIEAIRDILLQNEMVFGERNTSVYNEITFADPLTPCRITFMFDKDSGSLNNIYSQGE